MSVRANILIASFGRGGRGGKRCQNVSKWAVRGTQLTVRRDALDRTDRYIFFIFIQSFDFVFERSRLCRFCVLLSCKVQYW